MESTILFAGLVGAVGVLHLLSQAVDYVQRASGMADARKQTANKTKRSDWYVFFCWSDLVGSDAKDNSNRRQNGDKVGVRETSPARKTARRPTAQRPTLRLSA